MSAGGSIDGRSSLARSRVLIIGGAGFVGSHIADAALAQGAAEVRIFDSFARGKTANLDRARSSGRLTLIEGDIRDRPAVAAAIQGVSLVFHEAALRLPLCDQRPDLAEDVMVNGSMNVVEACVDAQVRRLIFASSDIAYGNTREIPTPETHPLEGETAYGAAKSTIENALDAARRRHGLDFVTLRYFSVYGPRLAAEGPHKEVLAHWMERLARGDPPLIHGDGLQTADFVYVTDVARANIAAALRAPAGEAINIGTGTETSLVELAATLARVMGSDLEPEHVDVAPLNPLRRRCAAVEKARRLLGIASWLELDAGLQATVHWWAEDRWLRAAPAARTEPSARK